MWKLLMSLFAASDLSRIRVLVAGRTQRDVLFAHTYLPGARASIPSSHGQKIPSPVSLTSQVSIKGH